MQNSAQSEISNLVLSKNEISLEVDGTYTLTATAVYVGGTTENVKAMSSIRIADVKDGIIRAISKGKATITVTYGDKRTYFM